MKNLTKENAIRVVNQSPQAVAVHNKAAWLAIFAVQHQVEDPVGSPAHVGNAEQGNKALEQFYDTFIAPNDIVFEVFKDTVNGTHVVRDLNVHTTMSPSLKLVVPMHLLYELEEQDGIWRIKRLAAHWELMPMMKQVFSGGLACLPVLGKLSFRMLRNQGVSGALGFCKAAFTVGAYGKQQLENFCDFINAKHEHRLQDFLKQVACVEIAGDKLALEDVLKSDLQIVPGQKRLVAGYYVSASFSCTYQSQQRSGVMLIEFDKKSRQAKTIRLYCD